MLERLQELVQNTTDNATLILTPEMVLLTDLGLDSFSLIELICKVEETFDIEIPDRIIGTLKTVGDVVMYAENNIKHK
jgi:acyl carrier protein